MCIRDRCVLDRFDLALDAAMTEARRHQDAAESAEVLGYIPVSYTHLRAHETVLDLVCRLLLEKKNSKATY